MGQARTAVKLALIADIHANLPALQAVLADVDGWRPDLVVVLGDIVNRGPHPRECHELVLSRARAAGWRLLAGNHEEYVLHVHREDAVPGSAAFAMHQHTYWTAGQLSGLLDALDELPGRVDLDFAEPAGRASCVHASLLGNRDGIYPEMNDASVAGRIDGGTRLFAVGHTHRPLIRDLDGTLVVNVGSVGLPFDGDRRAGYARAVAGARGWQVAIRRLTYDWRQTRADCVAGEFVAGSGAVARIICRELEIAHPLLAKWTDRYQQPIMTCQISVAQSVTEFLTDWQ